MAKDTTLLNTNQAAEVLNMTEDQILYLVRVRGIPHRVEDDGRLTFTKWEILARIIPAPSPQAMPKQQVDVSKMSKDEIMEVFSSILQQKAAVEAQELAKEKSTEVVDEPPAETVSLEKKEEPETPTIPEPEKETPSPVKPATKSKPKPKSAAKPKK